MLAARLRLFPSALLTWMGVSGALSIRSTKEKNTTSPCVKFVGRLYKNTWPKQGGSRATWHGTVQS